MRDYGDIVRRVEALPDAASRILGEAAGYPIYSVTLSQDASRPVFFINGGTHGDEPAGVEGALAFLEADQSRWLGQFQFEGSPLPSDASLPPGSEKSPRFPPSHFQSSYSYSTDTPRKPSG